MINGNLLTIVELSKKLNVSTRQIYRLVDAGLPYYGVGKRKRFDIEIVEEWLKCQK